MPNAKAEVLKTVNANITFPQQRDYGSMATQDSDAVAITGGTIVGATVTADNLITVADDLTAAGTIQGDALGLTARFNEIGTAAASTGVRLPEAAAGVVVVVLNNGASTINIFPAVGDNIDAAGVDTAITLATVTATTLYAVDAINWHSVP